MLQLSKILLVFVGQRLVIKLNNYIDLGFFSFGCFILKFVLMVWFGLVC